jgi:hypothetical protein
LNHPIRKSWFNLDSLYLKIIIKPDNPIRQYKFRFSHVIIGHMLFRDVPSSKPVALNRDTMLPAVGQVDSHRSIRPAIQEPHRRATGKPQQQHKTEDRPTFPEQVFQDTADPGSYLSPSLFLRGFFMTHSFLGGISTNRLLGCEVYSSGFHAGYNAPGVEPFDSRSAVWEYPGR